MPLAFVLLLAFIEGYRLVKRGQNPLGTTRNILILATALASIAAFLSGYQASSGLGDMSQEIQDAIGRHHSYGRLLLINSILMVTFFVISKVAIHGKRWIAALYMLTLGVQLVLTLWVGYLGGELVFSKGIGVQAPVNAPIRQP